MNYRRFQNDSVNVNDNGDKSASNWWFNRIFATTVRHIVYSSRHLDVATTHEVDVDMRLVNVVYAGQIYVALQVDLCKCQSLLLAVSWNAIFAAEMQVSLWSFIASKNR